LADVRIRYLVEGEKKLQAIEKRLRSLETANGVAQKKVTELNSKFTKLNTTVGRTSTRMAGLGTSMKNLGAAFGITTGIILFATVLRNAAKTVVEFQKNNAVLAGVLGKTRKQIEGLTKSAREFGGTTAKTASEVTKLQVSLARLGFTQKEIISLTGGIIEGSIALNAELDQTAELVGAMVRTFDEFETQDAGKIIDILTLATQKSALSFEKLNVALPIVGGAAEAAGIPFTRMVALLGKLADSGIDTSTSATALRNIFIEAASAGKSYDEILTELANSTNKLTASTDEFGKRAAVSASILAKNISTTAEFDDALQSAAGTAAKVAAEQLDTLSGSLDLAASAWQEFIFTIDEGEGLIGTSAKGAVDFFTTSLRFLTNVSDETRIAMGGNKEEIEELALKIASLNQELPGFEEAILGIGGAFGAMTTEIPEPIGLIEALKAQLKEFREEREKAFKKEDIDFFNAAITETERKLDDLIVTTKELDDAARKRAEATTKASNQEIEDAEIKAEKLEEIEERHGERLAEIGQANVNAANAQRLADAEQQQAVDDQLERVRIEKITARFNVGFALLRKNALASKALAVVESIIQGNLSVAKAAAAFPFPANLPGIAAMKALATLNTASIVASAIPIPKLFSRGVLDLKGAGSETSDSIHAMLSRGESVMTSKETRDFMPLLKMIRNKELNADITKRIIDGNFIQVSPNISISNDTKAIADAIRSQPQNHIDIDSGGFTQHLIKENSRLTKKARRYSV